MNLVSLQQEIPRFFGGLKRIVKFYSVYAEKTCHLKSDFVCKNKSFTLQKVTDIL
jgi:hypothetical protein